MKSYPNILLVTGTGRNVGKTLSACKIIQKLSETHRTVGVRISPHFHEPEPNLKYLYKSEGLVIVEEQKITHKDSSRMLQAGAEKVFYVQSNNENLADAFNLIVKSIHPEQPLVIESGGLYDILELGLLLFISGEEVKKEVHFRPESSVFHLKSNDVQQFTGENIHFVNGNITIDA